MASTATQHKQQQQQTPQHHKTSGKDIFPIHPRSRAVIEIELTDDPLGDTTPAARPPLHRLLIRTAPLN